MGRQACQCSEAGGSGCSFVMGIEQLLSSRNRRHPGTRATPCPCRLPPTTPEVCQAGDPLLVVSSDVAAGGVVNKRLPPSHEAVEQRRLADIGAPHDGHLRARKGGVCVGGCTLLKSGREAGG